MEDKISKIAQILELSSTETRENAICSYIENIIFCLGNEPLTTNDILDWINEIFEIRPIENEATSGIESLISNNRLIAEGAKYKLSDDRFTEIKRSSTHTDELGKKTKISIFSTYQRFRRC